MSSRTGMRQELKDLAKLATTMPKEPTPSAPPASVRPPAPESQPPSLSRLTVPPAVLAVADTPSAVTHSPSTPPAATPRRGRLWAAVGGAVLALALVGGVVVGSRWMGRSSAAHVTAEPPRADTAATPPAAPPSPAAAPIAANQATPTSTATTTATSAPTMAPASTSTVAAVTNPSTPAPAAPAPAAPASKSVAGQRPVTRPAKAKAGASSPSLVAVVPQGNAAHDSLTDAINKSIAAGSSGKSGK